MPNERAIVIGAGAISNAWFAPIAAEGVNVVAVMDVRLEAAEAQIAKFRIPAARASADLDKTLRDYSGKAEFVLDLTPPDVHCEVTCRALRAGFHVLGEKPMASSMDQAWQMVRASEEAGRLYMVSQSRRWDGCHAAIARVLREGKIGAPTSLNCDFFLAAHFGGFRDQMPSPLILDMAIHHFDLARMFVQAPPVAVYAEEFNPAGSWYKGASAANCIFEFAGGTRFCYRGSWCAEGCHTGWNGDWRITGTDGSIVYQQDKVLRGEVVARRGGFISEFAPLEIAPLELPAQTMHGALKEMLAFVRTGAIPQTECHDNIHSLAMVFAAIDSARLRQRVTISI